MIFEATGTPVKKSQLVIDQILARINDGTLPIGARLPSERDIAAQMRVSRTVVREALRALELAGVVESRIGDGTYVTYSPEPDKESSVFATLTSSLSASVDVMEALEARRALDLSVIRLLEESGAPVDTSVPNQLVCDMRTAFDQGRLSDYLNLSLDIHVAVAQLTGNRILTEVVAFLVDVTRKHLWVIERKYSPEKVELSFGIHAEMVEAIESQDFDAATRAVQRHYDDYPSLHPSLHVSMVSPTAPHSMKPVSTQ